MIKNQKAQFDDFDPFAQDYATIHNQNLKITGAKSEALSEERVAYTAREERRYKAPRRILDLGCGDGSTEVYLRKAFPNSELYGIDPSEASIQVARERKIANTKFNPYDGAHIPFPDHHFEVIFIAGVLHHIRFEHHRALMEECTRVLTKNGRIYIFEHNPFNPLTRVIVNGCEFDDDARLLTPMYLRRLLKRAGFRSRKVRYFIFFPRFSWAAWLVKLERLMLWLPIGGKYYARANK